MGLGSFLSGAAQLGSDMGSSLYRKAGNLKDDTGDLWNDVTGKTASRDAARAQMASANKATDVQRQMFDKTVELNEPWRQAGLGALGDIQTGINSGAFEAPNEEFSYSGSRPQNYVDPGFNFEADPGYKFRQQQQQQAVERSAAAGGGLFAGATLSDLAQKSGQMASDEFGAAYGRYNNNRNFAYGANRDQINDSVQDRNFAYGNFSDAQSRKRQGLQDRFSRLSTLAGLGEAATSRTGQAGTQFGQQAGDNAIGAGNARAAGLVGGYNSQRDTLMGLGNLGVKGASLFAGGGA